MISKTLWRQQIVITETEYRISEVEDRMVEINESEKTRKTN